MLPNTFSIATGLGESMNKVRGSTEPIHFIADYKIDALTPKNTESIKIKKKNTS